MKKLSAISLGLLMAASSAAFASGDGVKVHFKGHVNEPTCTVQSADPMVTLPDVSVSAFNNPQADGSIAFGETNFIIHLDCEENVSANNIKLTMLGDAATEQKSALTNRDSKNGVGLEVFHGGSILKPNDSINGEQLDTLSKGVGTIPMSVRYARIGNEVKGGDVEADVTFVTEYR